MVSINKDRGDDYWRVFDAGRQLSKHTSKRAAIRRAKQETSDWDDWIEVTGPRGGHDRIDVRDQPSGNGGNSGGFLDGLL